MLQKLELRDSTPRYTNVSWLMDKKYRAFPAVKVLAFTRPPVASAAFPLFSNPSTVTQ
jgi:hypothetical protein